MTHSTYFSKAFCVKCLADRNRMGGSFINGMFICRDHTVDRPVNSGNNSTTPTKLESEPCSKTPLSSESF